MCVVTACVTLPTAQDNYAASASDGALEEAQHNKLQMICDKLMLQEGESFLDIGCGWGTLVRHAAKHYGGSLVARLCQQGESDADGDVIPMGAASSKIRSVLVV